MSTYYVTQTALYQLKNAVKENKVMGVGMLSHMLGIWITNWREEQVVVASMYFPEENVKFFFPRRYIKVN